MPAARAFAIVLFLVGCPAKTESVAPPSDGEPTPGATFAEPSPSTSPAPDEPSPDEGSTPAADGSSCLQHSDCASGVCEGEGCTADAPGTCKPKDRMCTRDARSYCGCDGKPFIGSGSCPGARYQDPSACEGQPSPI